MADLDGWLTIPETLLSGALRELDPIWRPTTMQDHTEVQRHRDAATDVNRSLIEAMVEYLDGADLFCDHGVGICSCSSLALLAELRLLLEGKVTCRACGGEGFTWNQETHDREVALIGGAYDGEYGYVPCEICKSAGWVRLEEVVGS